MVVGEAEEEGAAAVQGEEEEEEEEERRRSEEEEEEEEEESGVGCDFCGGGGGGEAAVVYCRADAARLCLKCDRHVHAANSVSARHPRSLLCDACSAAPAAFLLLLLPVPPVPRRSLPRRRSSSSSSRVLCSNCDFEAARSLRVVERRAVESYSGCPSAAELAAMLGVGGDEKEAERGVWWGEEETDWAWAAAATAAATAAAAPVFSLEDLIVPTTSSHGFQALGTPPPLPKNRDSTCGKRREEILRQLQELAGSEAPATGAVSDELEPVAELQSWASEDAFQQGYAGPDIGGDVANIGVPIYEDSKWDLKEYQNPTDTLSVQFPYEEYPLKSAEATVSSLVEIADICAGTSITGTVGGGSGGQAAGGGTAQILPSRVRHDLPCPDRDTVISRYKEKRKTRRYEKLIRYESRKARADSRLRIKGRFAKMNQANNND